MKDTLIVCGFPLRWLVIFRKQINISNFDIQGQGKNKVQSEKISDLVHMKLIREAVANPITSIMLANNVLSKLDNNIDVCRYKMGI